MKLKSKLQYQRSTGDWGNCDDYLGVDRTEEFLEMCMRWNGPDEVGKLVPLHLATRPATRDEVIEALNAGRELRDHCDDWYSNCRIKPEPRPAIAVEMFKCSCGHTIPRRSVMMASLGTSCPECYDKMSG